MRTIARMLLCFLAWTAPAAFAATDITHNAIGYFVPEKRIRLEASVSDPRGIKLARTYFKVGPQADYLLVPMEADGANRYAAILLRNAMGLSPMLSMSRAMPLLVPQRLAMPEKSTRTEFGSCTCQKPADEPAASTMV